MTLSRNQIKHADRVGGIELMLPWPDHLPAPAGLREDDERPATPLEHLAAMQVVAADCEAAGLVPVRVMACVVRWPTKQIAPALAVVLIGRRWVHATGAPAPKAMWAVHPVNHAVS